MPLLLCMDVLIFVLYQTRTVDKKIGEAVVNLEQESSFESHRDLAGNVQLLNWGMSHENPDSRR